MASAVTIDSTPLDIRTGATNAEGVNHPLKWGIIGTGGISSDWSKCLKEANPPPFNIYRIIFTGSVHVLGTGCNSTGCRGS